MFLKALISFINGLALLVALDGFPKWAGCVVSLIDPFRCKEPMLEWISVRMNSWITNLQVSYKEAILIMLSWNFFKQER